MKKLLIILFVYGFVLTGLGLNSEAKATPPFSQFPAGRWIEAKAPFSQFPAGKWTREKSLYYQPAETYKRRPPFSQFPAGKWVR